MNRYDMLLKLKCQQIINDELLTKVDYEEVYNGPILDKKLKTRRPNSKMLMKNSPFLMHLCL